MSSEPEFIVSESSVSVLKLSGSSVSVFSESVLTKVSESGVSSEPEFSVSESSVSV